MNPVIGPLVVLFGSLPLADLANGVFEAGLSFFLWKGVLKLRVDKAVQGFYWPTVLWTTAWGLYNLYFYPHLGQWFSFSGGVAVVLVNITWLAHVAWYARGHIFFDWLCPKGSQCRTWYMTLLRKRGSRRPRVSPSVPADRAVRPPQSR